MLLYLSFNHLARGVQIVTLCQAWEGLAMAIGLDLLIVGLEEQETRLTASASPRPATVARGVSWSKPLGAIDILRVLASRNR